MNEELLTYIHVLKIMYIMLPADVMNTS